MRLTLEQKQRIVIEATAGAPPSLTTSEALDYRKEIEKDIERIKAKGGMVDLPFLG